MIKEVIATGRDADSAINNGCLQLGILREDAQFEILSLPKKSFLGLKTQPARVRVFVELPDPPKAPEPPKTETKPQQKPREKAADAAAEAVPRPPKPSPAPRPPRPEKAADRPAPAEKDLRTDPPAEIEPDETLVARVSRCSEDVRGILELLGVSDATVTPKYYAESVCLQLSGGGLGVIIGHRGETLDSIQYLASLVANRGEDAYLRINIDSGNYRQKREKTLEALARKLANLAVKTGKSTTLEPMNPYERRIIHGAVSQVKGATSSSIGLDPNRRVIISAINPPKRDGQRSGGRGGRGGRGGKGRGSSQGGHGPASGSREGRPQEQPRSNPKPAPQGQREKLDDGPPPPRAFTPKPPPSAPVPPTPLKEHPLEETDEAKKAPLYGKIEL